jgi:UDP-3-O-[3-hydroxymyristoyl] glucosamine N-acyltransferase
MTGHSIRDIAAALGAEALGAADLVVTGVAEPAIGGPQTTSRSRCRKIRGRPGEGRARAAVLGPGMDWQALGLDAAIIAPRPRYAMAGVTRAMDPVPASRRASTPLPSIDPSAVSARRCDRPLRPYRAGRPRSARNARIASHVSIAEGARIGDDALILPACASARGSGSAIASSSSPAPFWAATGFPSSRRRQSHVETARESLGTADHTASGPQSWTRIHSLGGLVIGDDVEIGANAAIDRGTIADTTSAMGPRSITSSISATTAASGATACCAGRWASPGPPWWATGSCWAGNAACPTISRSARTWSPPGRPRSIPTCRRAGC